MVQIFYVASNASVLFHWSISLFWYQYHAVLITVALQYSLKSGSVMPPAVFFLLRIDLAMRALFWFHMKFKLVYLLYLIALARTSNTVLNRSAERGHPCLVPVFKRNASSFCPLSMILAVGLS